MKPVYTVGQWSVIPLIVAYAVIGRDGTKVFTRQTVEDAIEDADMLAAQVN